MELELQPSSEVHFGSEVPLRLSFKDKTGQTATVAKVQVLNLDFAIGKEPDLLSGSLAKAEVKRGATPNLFEVRRAKMPADAGRTLSEREAARGVGGVLSCTVKVTFKIGEADAAHVTLSQDLKFRVRSGLPHRIEVAGLERFESSLQAGAALERDLSGQSFFFSVLDRWDNIFRGAGDFAALDVSFSLENCKFGSSQDRGGVTDGHDIAAHDLSLDFASGETTHGSITVECELTGTIREKGARIFSHVDFRVCSRHLRFSTPPHDAEVSLIALPRSAMDESWDLPEIRLALVDVDDLNNSVRVVSLGAMCQLQITPLPPGSHTVTRSTIVLNESLPAAGDPSGFSANQAFQIQEFVHQQHAANRCTGTVECVAHSENLQARLDITVAAGEPRFLEAFDVQHLQDLQIGQAFDVPLRLVGQLGLPVESCVWDGFDISMRLFFEGEQPTEGWFQPMQRTDAGARGLSKRKLPAPRDGVAPRAHLEIRVIPTGGGNAIHCRNLADVSVGFRSGPAVRLEFRREAGSEAASEWNYLSGDKFLLRLFAVDEFGNVDPSFKADVNVTCEHAGMQKFAAQMRHGQAVFAPFFFGVSKTTEIQVGVEHRQKRAQGQRRVGGLEGELKLIVQPGGWLRRPLFLLSDGRALLAAQDDSLTCSLESEEFLELFVEGEAWDGSTMRLDAAQIRITPPQNAQPPQILLQNESLAYCLSVPAAPAVYEFAFNFPVGPASAALGCDQVLRVTRLQGDVTLRMTGRDGLHLGELRAGGSLKVQVQTVTKLGHVCDFLDSSDVQFSCEPGGIEVTAVPGAVAGTISLTLDDPARELEVEVVCKLSASSESSTSDQNATSLECKYCPRLLVESDTAETTRDRERTAVQALLQKAEKNFKKAQGLLKAESQTVLQREFPTLSRDSDPDTVIRHCKDAIVTCTTAKLDLTRDGRDQRLTVVSLGEGMDSRKLQVDNNNRGRTSEITRDLPAKCLGVVADFGWIEIDEGFAQAVAALGGADLSALVFQSQSDALEWEQLGDSVAKPLKGVRFVALDSCMEAGIEQRLRDDLASTNVQGKVEFALDVIKYDAQITPGIGNLWRQVLGTALIFDRHQDLVMYQALFGNRQILVSRHPDRGWKLGGRVMDRREAMAASEVVQFVAPHTTPRHRNFVARILALEATTRSLEDLKSKEAEEGRQCQELQDQVASWEPNAIGGRAAKRASNSSGGRAPKRRHT
mmetsp:Transcript_36674/g.86908  ORF Transcript_36674/g.86908 Transcript_36674/m.86908 type:complete len:1217 (-) Transcript_36674:138-3788(-)